VPPPAPARYPWRTAPAPARAEAPVVDVPVFEDKSPPFSTSRADPTAPTAVRSPTAETRAASAAPRSADRRPETQDDAAPRRIDDTALGAAIDRALDETDGTSPK
jgi:hypothetical protein